ncbi:MAG: hypothetical protein HQ588_00860 [Deltaproteobacteria bacterium]|nr:hypothetical protein [Deltaproteobacteria bacterium]
MNWFKRHLNWTALFPILFWLFLAKAGGWIGWLIGLVICLPVAIWVLREKKQSQWWLFTLLIPILFLLLENKSQVLDVEDGQFVTRPRDKAD